MAARSFKFNVEIWLQGVLTWHNANWKKYVLSGCTTTGIYRNKNAMIISINTYD